MQRHAVHDGGHGKFAHAVVDVAPDAPFGIARHLPRFVHAHGQRGGGLREVGAGQIGAAAKQLGQRGGKRLQRQLAGLAAGDFFRLFVRSAAGVQHRLLKTFGQPPRHAALKLLGKFWIRLRVAGKRLRPRALRLAPGGAGIGGLIHVLRNLKGRIVPANFLAHQRNFLRAQRLAVRLGRALTVGAAVADGRLADDERGAPRALPRRGNGFVHSGYVVPVHGTQHIPAIGLEARRRVIGKPGGDLPINADAVVVVERNQLVQPPRARQRARLVADAFHQAAVAQKHIGVVTHNFMPGAVELSRQQLFRQRHAHGVGQPLTERPGRRLHAGRHPHLGVPRRLAPHLAEAPDFLHRHVVARQVQQRIQQHGGVPVGKHKAVAVQPARVGGVVAQMARPQRHRHFRHAKRRTRMARLGLLHGVHRQRADGAGNAGGSFRHKRQPVVRGRQNG